MLSKRRVVVTGIGAITPIGVEETVLWQSMVSGRSGVRRIRQVDVSNLKSPNGAEVDDEALAAALAAREWRPGERATDMALLASAQALEQAGVLAGKGPWTPQPVATIVGTSNGPSQAMGELYAALAAKGARGLRPTTVPRCMINTISSHISMRFRLTGNNYTVASACTSSTIAIGLGFRMIRDGYADRVLCVGADSLFTPATYGAWNNLGALSRNPDPARAARPFDRDRDGMIIGEGAGALLLEARESAVGRQARIRGEIAGFGESSDAEHITRPSPEGQADAIRAALGSAEIRPEEVGFINAHGTGTRASDEAESVAIRAVFGSHADTIPTASNKSYFGHLMGASGAVETIVALLGLEAGRMPGNLNLDNPDPACAIGLAGPNPVPIRSPFVVKNSFGFGGSNAVLVLRRYDAPCC